MLESRRLLRPVPLALCTLLCLGGCQKPFDLQFQKGEAAANAGKWTDARAAFAEAVKLDPQSAAAHARLAAVAWRTDDVALAESEWTATLTIDPVNELAVDGLARIALSRGDAGAALEATNPISEFKGSLRLTRARALLARSTGNDLEVAQALVQASLTETPFDAETMYLLGSLHIAFKRYGDAQGTFDELQRQHPKSALGSYGLARLAAAQNRQTDTLLYLAEARNTAGSSWQADRVAADPAFAFVSATAEFKALVGK